MSLRGKITGCPYPKCKHCGEWIDHQPNQPWTHYFSKKTQCYIATTHAEPGEVRRGPHSVNISVPGR
jgi:hypothetical protein